jgi:hypothetical protein
MSIPRFSKFSEVSARATLYHPQAREMSLEDTAYGLFLNVSFGISIGLRTSGSDPSADAVAMERLAALAVEAAARLRAASAPDPAQSPPVVGEVA